MQITVGAIIIVAGLVVILFRDRLTRDALNFQHKVFRFKYDQVDFEQNKIAAIVAGSAAVIIGILVAIGTIHLNT